MSDHTVELDLGDGTAKQGSNKKPHASTKRGKATRIRDIELCDFTVYVDSSEGLPYTFDGMTRGRKSLIVPTERHNILWGDYSIKGCPEIAIERKSISDCFSTLTHGRKRFLAEIEALNQPPYEYAAVVIEATWVEIADPTKQDPCWISRANPESIVGTIVAWQRHYPRVRWYAAGTRRGAEELVFAKLSKYWSEREKRG